MRLLNREHNGFNDTYYCTDYLPDLMGKRYNEETEEFDKTIHECQFVALWKHGPGTLHEFEEWVEDEVDRDLHAFEWSDELTLSAQKYMKKLSGCNIYEPQVLLSEWSSNELVNIATFDDHKRYVIYPERITWSSSTEFVFDAMLDDFHQNYNLGNDLLESSFTQIGIVCNCHPTFGQFCIIELGLNVVA